MAFAHVRTRTAAAGGADVVDDFSDGNIVVTGIPTTTVGNLLIVIATTTRTSRTVASVSGGATWSLIHQQVNASAPSGCVEIWAAICTAGVTSVTVTLSGTSDGIGDHVTFMEFSGPAIPLAEEGTSTGTIYTTSTSTWDAAAITPAGTSVLFVGAVHVSGGNGGTWGLDADFTLAFSRSTGEDGFLDGYRIQSGSAAAQAFSNTSTSSERGQVSFAAFAGAVGGSGSTVVKMMQQLS